MKELIFELAQDGDGGFTAEAIGESIFTQADNWDEVRTNVREAVQAFYFDSVSPVAAHKNVSKEDVLKGA